MGGTWEISGDWEEPGSHPCPPINSPLYVLLAQVYPTRVPQDKRAPPAAKHPLSLPTGIMNNSCNS